MTLLKPLFITLCRTLRIRRPQPETYLIPAYAGLGNFIMATPMILELKRRRPAAEIYLLTWPWYGTDQIFDAPIRQSGDCKESAKSGGNSSPVAGIFLLDPHASPWRKALFFLRLRRWKMSAAFIPFDACPAFVWWGFPLAGIRAIAAHSLACHGLEGGWIQTVPDITCEVELSSHESDIHLDLLDAYCHSRGITVPEARDYQTFMSAEGSGVLQKFGLKPREYIVVQISAANARFKTPKLWAKENWAQLIRRLENDGETIVLPGDENEAPLVDEFVSCHELKHAVNIAGRTSVREVSTVIKNAKLLVVHDSGLMHIGNAHGTPLVALYGPTDWNFTRPKAPTSRILRKSLPCQPCMARMAKTEQEALRDCQLDVQCMKNLSIEEVYHACRSILAPTHPVG
jgi:ADP-heptose:LPS heptosyltransferase